MGTSFDTEKMPSEKPSTFDPLPGQNDTLEEFLKHVLSMCSILKIPGNLLII